LREFNMDPVQVDWAVRCASWWQKTNSKEGRDLAKTVLHENIQLFKDGCRVCWTALFIKGMTSLGLGGGRTVEEVREMQVQDIGAMVFSEDSIREAYMSKYTQLFWDTHGTEPRHRGGRHSAFIKHNCWFHNDRNPALKLMASDIQVRNLLRFRLGTHRLRCNEHALEVRYRTCQFCDRGVVEDEWHLLLDCDAYDRVRD
jgi:hypothetical protein